LDLRGWKTNAATASRWGTNGERIALKEGSATAESTLWTEKDFGDAEFVLDCRPAKSAGGTEVAVPTVQLRGRDGKGAEVKLEGAAPGNYQRFIINVKGREVTVKRNDMETQRLTLPSDAPARGALGLRDTGGAVEFMNLYVRDL
jgi:hypothetical protein